MNQKILFSLSLSLLSLLPACKQPTTTNQTQVPAAPVFANETDYICGMKVQADWTDTCHYKGKVYAFCGTSCKEEFQAASESFLNKEKNQ